MIVESIFEVYLWIKPNYSEKNDEPSLKNNDDIFGNRGEVIIRLPEPKISSCWIEEGWQLA